MGEFQTIRNVWSAKVLLKHLDAMLIPDCWRQCETPNHRTHYVNDATNTNTWEKPSPPRSGAAASPLMPPRELYREIQARMEKDEGTCLLFNFERDLLEVVETILTNEGGNFANREKYRGILETLKKGHAEKEGC